MYAKPRHIITQLNTVIRAGAGFTLIELMIVIAIIAIVLTLALPVYSNYVIRAKISEALSIANSAKTAVSSACSERRNLASLSNAAAGYGFVPGTDSDDYVANVQVSGPCTDPVITVTTKNTGTSPDPIMTLVGELPADAGQITWECASTNAPNYLLPAICRS